MNTISSILSERMKHYPWYGMLVAILIFFAAQMLLAGVLVPLVGRLFDLDQEATGSILMGDFSQHSSAETYFRVVQFLNQLMVWAFPAWILAGLLGKRQQVLSFSAPSPSWIPALAIGTMLASVPLVQWLYLPLESIQFPSRWSDLQSMLERQELISQQSLSYLFQDRGPLVLALNVMVFAATPALCEEFFFRGYLLSQARTQWGVHLSVWVVALVFSLVHLQILGFFSRLVLGGLLGYFVVYGGSIWSSISAHFVFNASAIVAQVYLQDPGTQVATQEVRPIWYWALFSALLTGMLLEAFRRTATLPPRTYE